MFIVRVSRAGYSPPLRCSAQGVPNVGLTRRFHRAGRHRAPEPHTLAEVETKAAAHPAGAAVDERDFASLVRRHVAPFSAVKSLMERTVSGGDVARQAFAGIQQRAEDFVSFLDDHGARSNRTYAPLAEYAASVRGFAKMGRHLSHMEARLDRELPLPLGHENRFRDETRRTLEFVKWSLANLQEEALAEAGRLLGEPVHPPSDTQGDAVRDPSLHLPSTLDEAAVPQPERWIAEIASKFLAHKRILDRQAASAPGWTRKRCAPSSSR